MRCAPKQKRDLATNDKIIKVQDVMVSRLTPATFDFEPTGPGNQGKSTVITNEIASVISQPETRVLHALRCSKNFFVRVSAPCRDRCEIGYTHHCERDKRTIALMLWTFGAALDREVPATFDAQGAIAPKRLQRLGLVVTLHYSARVAATRGARASSLLQYYSASRCRGSPAAREVRMMSRDAAVMGRRRTEN